MGGPIYPTDGGFVISRDDMWLPGSYADELAAQYALDHFDYDELREINEQRGTGEGYRRITLEDLQAARQQ